MASLKAMPSLHKRVYKFLKLINSFNFKIFSKITKIN